MAATYLNAGDYSLPLCIRVTVQVLCESFAMWLTGVRRAVTILAMRIGIDARLPFYQMGGISQYVLHLLPALAALDQSNQIAVLQSWKDERDFSEGLGAGFGRKSLYTPCHHRLERWALSAELLPHNLDILHSPDFIPPQRGARRHLITVHDLNFLYYPEYLTADSRRFYNDQIAWAVAKADLISADSEHTRRDVIEKLGVAPDKIETVYLAANPLYQQAYSQDDINATLAEYALPEGFLLFVGTIEPRKNLPTLIRAYYDLRHEFGVTVPLVLVGRVGWLAEDVFELISQLNLEAHVRHLTGVFDEALAHLYHAASLLALASHYEGFGLPPLEAMHCGCPVVTSDRGSLPEIVGDAGFLLDADDVPLWTETLHHVLTDTIVREGMIARGLKQATRFEWADTARKTMRLYEALS